MEFFHSVAQCFHNKPTSWLSFGFRLVFHIFIHLKLYVFPCVNKCLWHAAGSTTFFMCFLQVQIQIPDEQAFSQKNTDWKIIRKLMMWTNIDFIIDICWCIGVATLSSSPLCLRPHLPLPAAPSAQSECANTPPLPPSYPRCLQLWGPAETTALRELSASLRHDWLPPYGAGGGGGGMGSKIVL